MKVGDLVKLKDPEWPDVGIVVTIERDEEWDEIECVVVHWTCATHPYWHPSRLEKINESR